MRDALPEIRRRGAELVIVGNGRRGRAVHDTRALDVFAVRPMGLREAIRRAMANEDQEYAATCWFADALSSAGMPPSWGGMRFGTRLVDARAMHVTATRPIVFRGNFAGASLALRID